MNDRWHSSFTVRTMCSEIEARMKLGSPLDLTATNTFGQHPGQKLKAEQRLFVKDLLACRTSRPHHLPQELCHSAFRMETHQGRERLGFEHFFLRVPGCASPLWSEAPIRVSLCSAYTLTAGPSYVLRWGLASRGLLFTFW